MTLCLNAGMRAAALALALVVSTAGAATASASVGQRSQGPANGEATHASAPPVAVPGVDQSLSNERTLTTWANVAHPAPIHAAPRPRSPQLATLHRSTEDGFPEVYLLLAQRVDASGRVWVRLRVPMRPNGRTGWVLRQALGPFHETHWSVVIDRGRHRLSVYWNGGRRATAPVGIGKPSTPTPAGRFWIREMFPITDRSSPYWPYAMGTSDYSVLTDWPGGGVIGIHGDWHQPWLIPGAPSHGCVRMHAADITWLARHLTVGTPVHII
jgi:hypothetical protein